MAERLSDVRLREIRQIVAAYPPNSIAVRALRDLLAEVERLRSPEVRALADRMRSEARWCLRYESTEHEMNTAVSRLCETVKQAADLLDAGGARR